MSNTIIAPRRTPFPIGTKMVFAQAAPPTDWTLDVADNDRYLRVVSGSGGGIGGPDNVNVSPTDLTHTHTLNNHQHALVPLGHKHDISHSHTEYATSDMATTATENSVNYRVRDDTEDWGLSSSRHIAVDGGGSDNEGQHNHKILGTIAMSITFTNSYYVSSGGNSIATNNPSPSLVNHSHPVNSNFRLAYVDIIIATLTQ